MHQSIYLLIVLSVSGPAFARLDEDGNRKNYCPNSSISRDLLINRCQQYVIDLSSTIPGKLAEIEKALGDITIDQGGQAGLDADNCSGVVSAATKSNAAGLQSLQINLQALQKVQALVKKYQVHFAWQIKRLTQNSNVIAQYTPTMQPEQENGQKIATALLDRIQQSIASVSDTKAQLQNINKELTQVGGRYDCKSLHNSNLPLPPDQKPPPPAEANALDHKPVAPGGALAASAHTASAASEIPEESADNSRLPLAPKKPPPPPVSGDGKNSYESLDTPNETTEGRTIASLSQPDNATNQNSKKPALVASGAPLERVGFAYDTPSVDRVASTLDQTLAKAGKTGFYTDDQVQRWVQALHDTDKMGLAPVEASLANAYRESTMDVNGSSANNVGSGYSNGLYGTNMANQQYFNDLAARHGLTCVTNADSLSAAIQDPACATWLQAWDYYEKSHIILARTDNGTFYGLTPSVTGTARVAAMTAAYTCGVACLPNTFGYLNDYMPSDPNQQLAFVNNLMVHGAPTISPDSTVRINNATGCAPGVSSCGRSAFLGGCFAQQFSNVLYSSSSATFDLEGCRQQFNQL